MAALIYIALFIVFAVWCCCVSAKNADEDSKQLWKEMNGENNEEK